MATLTDIESEILRQVSDTDEDNWEGDSELREALADALDEIAISREFFVEELFIALVDDVMFYEIGLEDAWPLWVKNVWYMDTNRKLDPETLRGLGEMYPSWMISRGSPRIYVPYSPESIIVWPCKSEDGGTIRLEVICTPKHYASSTEFLTIREEFENALIAYGRYHLLSRSGAPLGMWNEAFQEYLQGGMGLGAFDYHRKAMRKYMLKEDKRE